MDWLDEIEARAEKARENYRAVRRNDELYEILDVDIPRLLFDTARIYGENAELRAEVEPLRAENTRLRAELEAAKRDIRALSDEYKFCNMCKYHNGEGVDTCSHPLRFSCDAKNFYEWRGATENGGANGRAD